MGQMSFFAAEARTPRVVDLAGLLCGPGQAVAFGRGAAARVSAVLDAEWRVRSLVLACAERGVEAVPGRSDEGRPLVRTAFRADLAPLAARWLRGAVKAVPADFVPDGWALRLWALAAGCADPAGYRLGLDPHAPQTHPALLAALDRCGLPAKVVGERAGGPALRVTGRRRLARLAELVGPMPDGAIERTWPLVS
ncbi:hypothetical protein [Saccharopolyspora cebuensis]|uniref:Uncharacterized protein n=1 Tax=Saccharopolyspora cebuensis TaxID=418759 RepID=A0ABV4CN13_9PSEU